MVSKDNYMLFTPMLHEVASGMIETRHIVTPIRAFCNRSRFYSAIVQDIDLKNTSPKFLHDIIDILASWLPNNEQITNPEESHEPGRMEKHEVFNMRVLEFLSKNS